MNEIVIAIVTGIVSVLAGGGGMFAYLTAKQKNKQDAHESAVSEWKDLYDEMRSRLDTQEQENVKLKRELFQLKESINKLNIELQNYKKYESYINDLEKYIDHLLHTIHTVSTEEAYINASKKRPMRIIKKNNRSDKSC